MSYVNDNIWVNSPRRKIMNQENENNQDDNYINNDDFDFGFVEAYDDAPAVGDDRLLPDNTAPSAINCAFIGVGGGGGKLAKAFLDVGFKKTLLVNTTIKDQPSGVEPQHFLLIQLDQTFFYLILI